MAQKDVIEVAERYLKNLENSGIKIFKAYLYGSHAKNAAHHDSDIDIALVSDFFDEADDKTRSIIWSLSLRGDHRIEPVPISKKRFLNGDFSPIIEIVKKEGIELSNP